MIEDINDFKISIVFGPRQVGKSYLLNLIFNKNFPHKKSHFFDLEQTHDLLEFSGSPAEIQERITKAGKLIFIDEFHYIKNAGKIFKAIYDLAKRFPKKQIKIFASGSSSIEIHKHIKESMAGRVWTYQLMPLTLDEYLSANRADLT
ncbi:MAG: ATP-binding protein, partial [bacterium]